MKPLEVKAATDDPADPELNVGIIAETLPYTARQWFDLRGRGKLYLRRSTLMLENEIREGLVLANVAVEENHRRKGVLSDAISVIEEAAARMALGFVFVEAIMNPLLIPALKKRNYTIRQTKHASVEIGELVFLQSPDDFDAYKLINESLAR